MALDINGYNTDFNAFVKFAQNSFVTNDKTAVARFECPWGLTPWTLVFGQPTGVFPLITGIDVGESEVVITTSAVVNSDGVTVSVVESSDLAGETVTDTEALEEDEAEGRAEFTKSAETPRFYRLKAEEK